VSASLLCSGISFIALMVTYSCSIRIVFELGHDPVLRKADGAIDLTQVTAIIILKVVTIKVRT